MTFSLTSYFSPPPGGEVFCVSIRRDHLCYLGDRPHLPVTTCLTYAREENNRINSIFDSVLDFLNIRCVALPNMYRIIETLKDDNIAVYDTEIDREARNWLLNFLPSLPLESPHDDAADEQIIRGFMTSHEIQTLDLPEDDKGEYQISQSPLSPCIHGEARTGDLVSYISQTTPFESYHGVYTRHHQVAIKLSDDFSFYIVANPFDLPLPGPHMVQFSRPLQLDPDIDR